MTIFVDIYEYDDANSQNESLNYLSKGIQFTGEEPISDCVEKVRLNFNHLITHIFVNHADNINKLTLFFRKRLSEPEKYLEIDLSNLTIINNHIIVPIDNINFTTCDNIVLSLSFNNKTNGKLFIYGLYLQAVRYENERLGLQFSK